MRHYRTEILIPADRSIQLQLPDDMVEGRAIVTIEILSDSDLDEHSYDPALDDIEWWEEFGEGGGDDVRLRRVLTPEYA